MGCFLGCFGLKRKKKKRQKSSIKGQDQPSYVPLDSDISIKLDIKENIISDSNQLKEKAKEPKGILKNKKKVRFNLNVKAYEPIPNNDVYLSDDEEGTKREFNTETKSTANLQYEEDDVVASSITSYRYQNCRDSYDDEDNEMKLNENDLNFDEIEDTDDVYSDESQDDFQWKSNPVAVNTESEEKISCYENLLDLKKANARDRSQYVFSVLNPVENLSQWKVVKASAASATPRLKYQKENLSAKSYSETLLRNPSVSHHPGHTLAVDASLSNWLSSFEDIERQPTMAVQVSHQGPKTCSRTDICKSKF